MTERNGPILKGVFGWLSFFPLRIWTQDERILFPAMFKNKRHTSEHGKRQREIFNY